MPFIGNQIAQTSVNFFDPEQSLVDMRVRNPAGLAELSHWRKEMNQLSNCVDDIVANPAPLFASSWIALFRVIRCSLEGLR